MADKKINKELVNELSGPFTTFVSDDISDLKEKWEDIDLERGNLYELLEFLEQYGFNGKYGDDYDKFVERTEKRKDELENNDGYRNELYKEAVERFMNNQGICFLTDDEYKYLMESWNNYFNLD